MRLFIGIPLDKKIKENIFQIYKKLNIKKVKWVEKENLHITLKFLGECDEIMIDEIKKSIDASLNDKEKFFISIDKISAFPVERKAKIIYLHIFKHREKIKEIFDELEDNLEKLNFKKDNRIYKPHITVGRLKKEMDIYEKIINFKLDFKTQVNSVILYRSILKKEGPLYIPLYEKQLI